MWKRLTFAPSESFRTRKVNKHGASAVTGGQNLEIGFQGMRVRSGQNVLKLAPLALGHARIFLGHVLTREHPAHALQSR